MPFVGFQLDQHIYKYIGIGEQYMRPKKLR